MNNSVATKIKEGIEMSRFVTPRIQEKSQVYYAQSSQNNKEHPFKDAAERVAKYIPGEIVSGYILVMGIINAVASDDPLKVYFAWSIFVLGLIATPIYLIKVCRPMPSQRPQVVIATIAFVLWAYALGGPFKLEPVESYYREWIGAVLVASYTWMVGLFYIPEENTNES